MSERASGLRAALFRLVVGVVVVDAVAILIRSRTSIATTHRGELVFTAAWMVATLAVVIPGLIAVRKMRRR